MGNITNLVEGFDMAFGKHPDRSVGVREISWKALGRSIDSIAIGAGADWKAEGIIKRDEDGNGYYLLHENGCDKFRIVKDVKLGIQYVKRSLPEYGAKLNIAYHYYKVGDLVKPEKRLIESEEEGSISA